MSTTAPMPQTGPRTRASDATLEKAEDVARAALLEHVAADEVGVHLGCFVEAERVVTHTFSCERAGYRGWRWSVTVARASRQRTVTVDEVVLIPGEEAIVAPAWVPWRDRVRPGDLSPGDLLPVDDDDPRLVPTWSFGDDPVEELLDEDERDQVRRVSRELGLGRVRTLSVEGRDQATQRWYAGVGGPHAAVAKAAPSDCMSCGFLVRLAGPLSETFGVCANANANDDGRVVSLDHGCGAHSEAQVARRNLPAPLPDPVVDELTLEDLERF